MTHGSKTTSSLLHLSARPTRVSIFNMEKSFLVRICNVQFKDIQFKNLLEECACVVIERCMRRSTYTSVCLQRRSIQFALKSTYVSNTFIQCYVRFLVRAYRVFNKYRTCYMEARENRIYTSTEW